MIYQLFGTIGLKRTLNLARTQATCADIDALYLAIDNRADALDVRFPLALRPNMGMADMHTGLHALRANFTNTCHILHLPFAYGYS